MVCVKRKLKQRRFEQRTPIRSAIFFTLKLLDGNKFEFLSVFTVIETIFPQLCAKTVVRKKKKRDHFRLTFLAKKRLKLTIREFKQSVSERSRSTGSPIFCTLWAVVLPKFSRNRLCKSKDTL